MSTLVAGEFSSADYEALEHLIINKCGQNIKTCLGHILTKLYCIILCTRLILLDAWSHRHDDEISLVSPRVLLTGLGYMCMRLALALPYNKKI